jgi:hypothetical protein
MNRIKLAGQVLANLKELARHKFESLFFETRYYLARQTALYTVRLDDYQCALCHYCE